MQAPLNCGDKMTRRYLICLATIGARVFCASTSVGALFVCKEVMPGNSCELFPPLLSHKPHYRDANSDDCYAKPKRPPDIPAGTFLFVKVLERGEREGRKLL